MDRKIKLAAAVSLVGLSAAACAPNPYWQYPGTNYNAATTRSTAAATNNKASVTHSHNGKVHSHPLPAQGLSHTHNSGQGGVQTNTNYNYAQQPQNNSYYTQPNTYSYDSNAYNSGSSYGSGSSYSGSYYDYSAPKNDNYTSSSSYDYTYTAPPTNRANTQSGGNTYVVQKGDTVFQVMRNTGVYWKDIIRLNNLQAPDYTIQPGQTLRLK